MEQFRSSELFKLSAPLNQNAPWSRYACKPLRVAGEQFAADICFKGGELYSIGLAVMRPEFGESWSDWSEEKERARLKLHNALLKKTLGRGSGHYRFAWGTVDSELDARSGGSSINTCYVLSD